MACLPETTGATAEQLSHLRECCQHVWGDQGHDRVKKEVAHLLLAKAAKESFQLRLHVVGHMLNVQLGKDWKQKYGVDIPMAQLLQSDPFAVVPTDIPNVDAVRLNTQCLVSMPEAHRTAANADSAAAGASKVRVVPRPASIPPAAKGSPKILTANAVAGSSMHSNSTSVFSPKAGTVKGVAVLAFINSMRWHEQQQINMLRQALASNIVRKATGVDGKIAAVTDTQQYSVTAAHAVSVIEKAWHGRYPSEPNPHSNLQNLVGHDPLLKLVPATNGANSSSSSEQRVQLDIRLLLERMSSKGSTFGSPAAPLTPAAAGSKPLLSATASPNPAGEAAAAKLMGLLTGKAGKPAAGAVFSRAVAAAALSAPSSAAGASSSTAQGANVNQQQQQQEEQKLEGSVHKKVLLNFIQRRHWDHDVEYNLMKRAVATFLVNKAAEGLQECAVAPVTIHVAKAGEVFHKVWTGRHGTAEKPYKKVADVLGSDQYLTIQDGPNHARQLVQLDIPAMVAAAGASMAAEVSTAAEASTALAGQEALDDLQSTTAAGDAIMQEILQADAEDSTSPAAETAAGLIVGRAASDSLLAVDLLAYASLASWHESHAGLNLLRQQLACMIIEAAHPGLDEAVIAGELVVASKDEARYAMSPYAAGSALMAIWQAHHPDEPRPYTTLPSALEGCRYLVLRLSAGGYQVQLDLQQYMEDCKAAMQQMQSSWQNVADAITISIAAKVSQVSASSTDTDATATVAECTPTAVSGGGSEGSQQMLQLRLPTETSLGTPGTDDAAAAAASPSFAGDAAAPAAARRSSAGSGFSAIGPAELRRTASGQGTAVLQPQVPNMQQLLNLLSYAPPGICQHAAVVWVPEAVQQLMFSHNEAANPQQGGPAGQAASGMASAAMMSSYDGGYELYGIQKLQDSAGVNRMLDHLLACPILAIGGCVTPIHAAANPGSPAATADRQQQILLQVLAPPVVGHDSRSALDAAVYVFEVPRKQQQGGVGGCKQLAVLLRILLEDARVVKLVDGHHMLPLLQQRYGINMAGVVDVHMLESMLAPRALLEDLSMSAIDVGGLEGSIAAYNLTSGQLEGSKSILRSLMQRGCSEKKPIPAELISTAASAVRPLMPLALSMLQLLPMGLMRRCSLAVNIPAPIATKELPGAIATSAPLPSGVQAPHQHQLLPLQGGFELGVSAMGKQHQQPMAGWGGGVPAVASPVGGLAGLYGGMF